MPLDRDKALANAERLLKQGRVSAALEEYRLLAEDAPRDVLTLNRIGDSLARAGRTPEAVGYYEKAGDHFAQAGFYPRAVAILKKIVKLSPDRLDVAVKLADLYVRQNLVGEARPYFLQAADAFLKARQFGKTREVYERLVAADPGDHLNRVRLAEARAAEGDVVRAGEDLLQAAGAMLASGRVDDAERTYLRASELLPDRPEAVAGLAASLVRRGRADEALATVDAAVGRRPADPLLLGEKLVLLESLKRHDLSAAFLATPQASSLRDGEILRAFVASHAHAAADGLLERMEPLFVSWSGAGSAHRVSHLLDRLAFVVDEGWPPPLERLLTLRIEENAPPKEVGRLFDRMIAAYEARGDASRASELRGRRDVLGAAEEERDAAEQPGADDAPIASFGGMPDAVEAPAVPLSPQEREAVSGSITEAEVFLKYGLQNEALKQLREVVRRFPGHVDAVQRLVAVLRTVPGREELHEALVTLALARRAAGDLSGGREAAAEAATIQSLAPGTLEAFLRLGLLEAKPAAASVPAGRRPPPPEAIPAPALREEEGEDFFIEFGAADDGDQVFTEAPSRPKPGPAVRVAPPDMIDEIGFYIDQGMADEARKKISALRMLGFSGTGLDDLERRAEAAPVLAPPQETALAEEEGGTFVIDEASLDDVVSQVRLDDTDLFTVTEGMHVDPEIALAPPSTVPETEQSVDEVFDEFKRQVEEEIGTGDFRTHYDLGIAYKEMGLLDDALGAFVAASRAPELFREACIMMAVCHRQRGEPAEAVRCYRDAIAAGGEEADPLSGVRYDLAELLVEVGDVAGALSLFREILGADPSYRDVRAKVAAMEKPRKR